MGAHEVGPAFVAFVDVRFRAAHLSAVGARGTARIAPEAATSPCRVPNSRRTRIVARGAPQTSRFRIRNGARPGFSSPNFPSSPRSQRSPLQHPRQVSGLLCSEEPAAGNSALGSAKRPDHGRKRGRKGSGARNGGLPAAPWRNAPAKSATRGLPGIAGSDATRRPVPGAGRVEDLAADRSGKYGRKYGRAGEHRDRARKHGRSEPASVLRVASTGGRSLRNRI
jgi:hypothetical protein